MKKIIKLTESDLTNIIKRVIIEQKSEYAMDAQANAIARASGIRSQEDYNTVNRITKKAMDTTMGNMDKHTAMTLLQIGTAFIPFVGPFISMGIGLADAAIYYNEGDKKTAGLVGVFSVIPGVGGLASKLGLSKWGAKALGELGKKISTGAKLLPNEMAVAKRIAQKKDLILSEINNFKSSFKPKPSFAQSGGSKNLIPVTGGSTSLIPQNVKLFLQKMPNIRVNDFFFKTINGRKENILNCLKTIKKYGTVGNTTKIEYNGLDIALTNLKNMSETISKNANFNLKYFMEESYRVVDEINDIQKRLPKNEAGVWNNLDHVKDSMDILIKSLEQVMK